MSGTALPAEKAQGPETQTSPTGRAVGWFALASGWEGCYGSALVWISTARLVEVGDGVDGKLIKLAGGGCLVRVEVGVPPMKVMSGWRCSIVIIGWAGLQ
jgi:hypothetical protein